MGFKYGKDITSDLTAGDVDLTAKRAAGADGYGLYPTAILISPSADDQVELKTVIGKLMGHQNTVTVILECGIVHKIAFETIIKTGTTTNPILVFGDPI